MAEVVAVMGVMVVLDQGLVMILALVLVMVVEQEGVCMEVGRVIVAVVDIILMPGRRPSCRSSLVPLGYCFQWLKVD